MNDVSTLVMAEALFSHRAKQVLDPTDRRWLSYVSGRDPRLWTDEMYDNLIESIRLQLELDGSTQLWEIGCAAGFLAAGLAPHVSSYTGVDMSRAALAVLESMDLPNVNVIHADGRKLPLEDCCIDTALCYDVVTNFDDWADVVRLGEEVARVLTPGGRWLLGSIPDSDCQAQIETVAQEVSAALDQMASSQGARSFLRRKRRNTRVPRELPVSKDQGAISCFYFDRQSFLQLAENLNLDLELLDIHALNPYFGLRFNALFRKPAS
jgi:SAM-dependent methyltransferase